MSETLREQEVADWIEALEAEIHRAIDGRPNRVIGDRLADAIGCVNGLRRALGIESRLCPRCHIRERASVARDANGKEYTTHLAKWCHECLATP